MLAIRCSVSVSYSSMVVLCCRPDLHALLTKRVQRISLEQRKLSQRVAELMAADSLDEFVCSRCFGLNMTVQPPNPTFTMTLTTEKNLVFSVVDPDDRITADASSWSLVKSVNLIGCQ